VSYNEKHNDANGEENRDGANDNHSWNMGVEGPTDDPQIIEVRERQKRNLLATLLLSQGVPMICGGDEIDRDQHGNNNAYCQDNNLTWYDWNLDERRLALLEFTRKLIRLRRDHPNFHRRKFYQDRSIRRSDVTDIVWIRPDGGEMTDEEWSAGWVRCLGVMLNGETLDHLDESGERILDDTFLIMLNCHHEPIKFYPPAPPVNRPWEVIIDTNRPDLVPADHAMNSGEPLELERMSLVVMAQRREDVEAV
jgi:glycogen operon protein